MNLSGRLDLVTERSVLLQVLREVEKDPDEYDDVVEALCDSLELFRKFLTPQEFTTKLEPILKAQDPRRALISLSRCLTDIKGEVFRNVMVVLSWVKCVAEENMSRAICDSLKNLETDHNNVQLCREFAVTCVNLPEKMSNCRGTASTSEHLKYISIIISAFKMTLVKGIQKAMLEGHNARKPNLTTLAELMSAGRNMDMDSFPMLTKMMQWVENIEDFDEKWRTIMTSVFLTPTILGVQVHEALLTSIFLSAQNEKQLERCVAVSDITGTLRRVVMVKLPFQRLLEPWTAKMLVDFVFKTKEELAVNLLVTALKVWSDSNYAKKTPDIQERHLVRIILHLVFLLKTRSSIPWSDLFLIATNGVFARMDGLPTFIRSGIFINEIFCKQAAEHSPKGHDVPEPPNMSDLSRAVQAEKEWTLEMRLIFEKGIQKTPIKREDVQMEPNKPKPVAVNAFTKLKKRRQQRKKKLAEKAQLDSDDDEEDFPTYEVAESEKDFKKLEIGEEPKSSVPPPAYIADAFEMLLEKEKYEVFESAFFHLPVLIRRKAVGFNQLAEQIVLRVVNLQNNFGTRNFSETVEDIASACISHRPEIVPSLIKIMIAPGQGDRVQQSLFHYIHKAADEMGHLDEMKARHIKEQVRKMEIAQLQQEELFRPDWQKVIEARIAAKTRVITAKPKPPTGTVNRLGQAARYMFYPLLVLPRGENARLLNEQSDLLALIIMVASMVYIRSGISPTITTMTNELLAYVTPHRFSSNPKVRAAVLAAYLNIMALLPDQLLVAFYPTEIRKEWQEWCEVVMTTVGLPEIETDMAAQLHAMLENHFENQPV